MARKIKYYLVAAEALPEIFIRVAEAKRMMQTGEAEVTVGAIRNVRRALIAAPSKYKGRGAALQRYEVGAYHYVLHPAEGISALSSVLGVFCLGPTS